MKSSRFLCPALHPAFETLYTTPLPRRTRASYIAFSRRFVANTACLYSSTSHFQRSDFANQPFTGSYEPGLPTSGPLGGASMYGAPRLTPKMLKQHLDQF